MARIRTIKPEFPQSESMGRVSREARLCFILLWTLADDAGRMRGNSRMLASLLYPYDDDAKKLIDKWLDELVGESCIERYKVAGEKFVQICSWMSHQKIDKPSPSKIPAPQKAKKEDSRGFANSREGSAADQGEEGKGKEGNNVPTVRVDSQGEIDPSGESGEAGDGESPSPPPVDDEPYRVPPCDVDAVIAAYVEALPQMRQPAILTDSRRGYVTARWRDVCAADQLSKADAVAYFRRFFAYVAKSDFLTGSGPPGRDGRVWAADLFWLLRPENFANVIEGKYHNKRKAA